MSTHQLRSDDGVRIDARHDPPRRADAPSAFVVAHGFTGGHRRPALRGVVDALQDHGGVVSFDFRGHGRSAGDSTVGDTEVLDLAAAVCWARGLGYRRVVTVGFSMGAAVAVRQAAVEPGSVDAVVAVSGPSRWNYRGTRLMRRLQVGIGTPAGRAVLALAWRTRVAMDGWDPPPLPPDSSAACLQVPLLLVHGDADGYFPVEHALWLARAAPAAELWVEPGFGHAETDVDAALVGRIAAWAGRAGSARMPR